MAKDNANKPENDFERMIDERMSANLAEAQRNKTDVSNPKLRDMNKKLPDWNLEPPFAFLSDR